jgi:hypothetical protein
VKAFFGRLSLASLFLGLYHTKHLAIAKEVGEGGPGVFEPWQRVSVAGGLSQAIEHLAQCLAIAKEVAEARRVAAWPESAHRLNLIFISSCVEARQQPAWPSSSVTVSQAYLDGADATLASATASQADFKQIHNAWAGYANHFWHGLSDTIFKAFSSPPF